MATYAFNMTTITDHDHWLSYQDFIAVVVKMCKIHKHGGFSQSRSHIYIYIYIYIYYISIGIAIAYLRVLKDLINMHHR